MKQSSVILSALLGLLLFGCGKLPTSFLDSFEVTENITEYERVYSDKTDFLSAISTMAIADDVLILKHNRGDHYFSFIDIDNGRLITSWGRPGRGPTEYISLTALSIQDSTLITLDNSLRQINFVSIPDILAGKEDDVRVIKEQYPYIVDFRPRRIETFDDIRVAVGSFEKGSFGIFDSRGEIMECPYDYPFNLNKNVKGIYRGSTYQSLLGASQKQRKFVTMTFASDLFEIFEVNPDGSIHRTYISPFEHSPQAYESHGRYTIDGQNSIAGLSKLAVSDDLICFAYSPQNFREYIRGGSMANEILCFNWDGEKVKKLILPFPLRNFCIDENYIYGEGYEDDAVVIYRFKL